ncbi:MAG: hypothetical protein IJS82_01685 [Paludibacteraceae bacterium]|nr:hypothetical protein [Paludibacteraceae bacterium]
MLKAQKYIWLLGLLYCLAMEAQENKVLHMQLPDYMRMTLAEYADTVRWMQNNKEWEKSKKYLDLADPEWGYTTELRCLNGRYYYHAGNYDEARVHLLHALQEDDSNEEALELLVKIEQEQGNYATAIVHVNDLLTFSPYNIRLWRKKIELYRQSGNDYEADRLLARLAEIYPEDDQVKKDVAYQQELKAEVRPAKTADYSIYSGKHSHTASQGAAKIQRRAQAAEFAYYKVQDGNVPAEYRDLIPAAVTSEERAYVLDYIRQHSNEHTQTWNHSVYFLQSLGSSYAYYSGTTLIDHNGAWHGVTGGNHMDYLVINNRHINDYNAAWGPDALCVNLPFADPTYHDSWGDKDNTKHDAWCIYQIPNYGYYLCFDYRTAKNSGEYYNGDGVYNDWVIKLTPADNPTDEPDIPIEPIVVPIEPTGSTTGHVEVNLSLNEEKPVDDYIWTKLSLHVRDTTDVEVYLPVSYEFYCELDDMYIVQKHQEGAYVYNDYVQYVSMNIADQIVTMAVRFEQEGIRITTSGINAEVLRACCADYEDGITFEIWNYYHDTNRTALQAALNNSSITFTSNPGYYLNAFGPIDHEETGVLVPNPLDCTVLPPTDTWQWTNPDDLFQRVWNIR